MKARYEVTVAKNPILGAPKRTKVIHRKIDRQLILVVVVVGGASEASGVDSEGVERFSFL